LAERKSPLKASSTVRLLHLSGLLELTDGDESDS
jgi:hypothetical protein